MKTITIYTYLADKLARIYRFRNPTILYTAANKMITVSENGITFEGFITSDYNRFMIKIEKGNGSKYYFEFPDKDKDENLANRMTQIIGEM